METIKNKNGMMIFVYSLMLFISCSSNENTKSIPVVPAPTPVPTPVPTPTKTLAKFEPKEGEVILFIGQENDAIGGTSIDTNGYFDFFQKPSGFTMYTNMNLDGVYQKADWGDGPENMSVQLADDDFKNCALAIGFSIVNMETKIANGEQDAAIAKLGEFLLSLGKRPVFLRIGYEFDGPWNNYNKASYITAFRRIKDKLDAQGVRNVAYVWQSKGFGSTIQDLESWYPGDKYVDWCAYSFFNYYAQSNMIDFATRKGKPVFIAEATPTVTDFANDPQGNTGLTKEMILSNPDQSLSAWNDWFVPFFKTINDNPKQVKAISYINANWKDKPMWKTNVTFKGIDSRIQLSKYVSDKWNEEIAKPKYLKPSAELFDKLYSGL
jgi:hypothetical protein